MFNNVELLETLAFDAINTQLRSNTRHVLNLLYDLQHAITKAQLPYAHNLNDEISSLIQTVHYDSGTVNSASDMKNLRNLATNVRSDINDEMNLAIA